MSTAKISSAKYDYCLRSVKTPKKMKDFRQKVDVNREDLFRKIRQFSTLAPRKLELHSRARLQMF